MWATAGGDFAATASATQDVTGIGFYTWSGPQMIADVQGRANNSATDFGWIRAALRVTRWGSAHRHTGEVPARTNGSAILLAALAVSSAGRAPKASKILSDSCVGASAKAILSANPNILTEIQGSNRFSGE